MRNITNNRLTRVVCLLALTASIGACGMHTSRGIRNSIAEDIDRARLGAHAIDIEVRQGAVTLDGTVASDAARRTVEEIATNTEGVEQVQSNLRVVRGAGSPGGGSELARTVLQRIKSSEGIGTYQIEINSIGNRVILSGMAASQNTREALESVARATPGVESVENLIQVQAG